MIWQIDSATQAAAHNFPVHIYASAPLPEYPGGTFYAASWTSRLRPTDGFPSPVLVCSPGQIIAAFQAAHYLQALAFTICWGGMARRIPDIYRQHRLQHIYNVLDQCAHSIQQSQDIQHSWDLLTNGLQCSHVVASKTLPFLCRALGFQQDPPVPIYNAVILNKVWPAFQIGIPPAQRPQDWSGTNFSAYARYMTAILEWSHIRNWTTTDLEATIYAENQ